MKLRLKDDSFRFRITLRELEELNSEGKISCQGFFPGPFGQQSFFSYSVKCAPQIKRGTLVINGGSITLVLSKDEVQRLNNPDVEGIYLREEWSDESGAIRRSIAFIEKDRPSSMCDKPEQWIYDDQSRGALKSGRAG